VFTEQGAWLLYGNGGKKSNGVDDALDKRKGPGRSRPSYCI
jgi:hypothetical protein